MKNVIIQTLLIFFHHLFDILTESFSMVYKRKDDGEKNNEIDKQYNVYYSVQIILQKHRKYYR